MPGENRYFWGSCYPENMIPNWKEEIDFILQKPFAYCVHNADKAIVSEDRKEHVHIILAYGNNSTSKAACRLLNKLSLPGKQCCPFVEACDDVGYCYEYLIHNTDNAKKKGKHLYQQSERITGNGFDIGLYVQLTKAEKDQLLSDLEDFIIDNGVMNFIELVENVKHGMDRKYLEIVRTYQSYLNNLCKGAYHRFEIARKLNERDHPSAP